MLIEMMIDSIIENITPKDAYVLGRKDAMQECLDEIGKCIKPGKLSGNGCDEIAERNGMVIVSNVVYQKLHIEILNAENKTADG